MIALIDGDFRWTKTTQGYLRTTINNKRVLQHRYKAEQVLGRSLKGKERVHHIDYDKTNNQNNNLVICPDDSYHRLLHARTDCIKDGYNPNTHHYCTECGVYHTHNMFPKNKSSWSGLHNMCKTSSNKKRRGKGYGKFNWKERLMQQYRRIFNEYTQREICFIPKEGRSL